MEKYGYLVYGGESSGCRWLTRLFIAAGCVGDGDHYQRMNDQQTRQELLDSSNHIVWRHSVPEAFEWPEAASHVKLLEESGRSVRAFIIVRDWWPMANSQVANRHVDNMAAAFDNLKRAYRVTLDSLHQCGCDYSMVTYESFVLHPDEAVRTLMYMAGLPMPVDYEKPLDQNAKWYDIKCHMAWRKIGDDCQ